MAEKKKTTENDPVEATEVEDAVTEAEEAIEEAVAD